MSKAAASVCYSDFGSRTSKSLDSLLALLQLRSVLKTWLLLNQPSSSQNVSLLIGLFFFFSPLEGSQVTGVQATHWYQCDWL